MKTPAEELATRNRYQAGARLARGSLRLAAGAFAPGQAQSQTAMTSSKKPEPVLAFERTAEWHAWLADHHADSRGVLLRIPKKAQGAAFSYAEALDAALAWGWIDSHKRAHDAQSWLQRFSPRTRTSPWSKINRAKAEALIAAGKMQRAGMLEVERAKHDGRWERAYDGARTASVPDDLSAALSRNARARAFFESLDATNRYAILYRIQAAKKPETRAERIKRFVSMCARKETLHPQRPKARK